MSFPKLPWEPGFVPASLDQNLINSLNQVIGQPVATAEQVITQVEQGATAAATAAVGAAEQAAGEAVGAVVSPATRSPSPATTPGGGTLVTSIEEAALSAAKTATASVLPSLEAALEKTLAARAQAELTKVLDKIQGGATTPAPTPEDFTKADSRSRALRTLLTGLALSAVWGLVNILGNLATVDWHNTNAGPQVTAMVVSSVVGSVLAYVERTIKEPAHVANATIIPGSPPSD